MDNRIILITGGSRGLGRSAALHLAERGHDILLTYQSRDDAAQQTVAEIEQLGRKAVALQLDAGAAETFADFTATIKKTLADTWQRDTFDGLINNAGMALHETFASTTEAQFDAIMAAHVKARSFLPSICWPCSPMRAEFSMCPAGWRASPYRAAQPTQPPRAQSKC